MFASSSSSISSTIRSVGLTNTAKPPPSRSKFKAEENTERRRTRSDGKSGRGEQREGARAKRNGHKNIWQALVTFSTEKTTATRSVDSISSVKPCFSLFQHPRNFLACFPLALRPHPSPVSFPRVERSTLTLRRKTPRYVGVRVEYRSQRGVTRSLNLSARTLDGSTLARDPGQSGKSWKSGRTVAIKCRGHQYRRGKCRRRENTDEGLSAPSRADNKGRAGG